VPWFTAGRGEDVAGRPIGSRTELSRRHVQGAAADQPSAHDERRSDDASSTLASTIESAVREADASVPVVRLREMDDVFAESVRRPRLLAQLLGMFAGLALLLAAIGTYGVLSYMVTERRREIGVRIALGANQGRVLGDVLKQGLGLAAAGLAAGVAGALALTRLMTALLFGVEPSDPTTLAAVMATIAGVAALACIVPAWRASRVDPIVVLREE
jgi:ABC-type antimicrobial peptide transport system permease subunit